MNDSSGLIVVGRLLAVIVLVLANGFFVAAEFSLVALRHSRVEQLSAEGHPGAQALKRAVNNLDSYLAATQLGITMASLGLGWVGEPALAGLIEPVFHLLPRTWALVGSHTLSVIVAFTIITSLHIVLGELAPKSLALQRTEATALVTVKPLEVYFRLFRPVIQLMNGLGNLVLRLLGLPPGSSAELIHSTEELKLLISSSRKAGHLGETQEDVVERVLSLGNRKVKAFMTPRPEIVWLDIDHPPETIQQEIIQSNLSRFLVGQDDIDNFLGWISAKEFLVAGLNHKTIDLRELLQQPLYLPENMSASDALGLFKKSGSSLAVVVDEYGVIQGLVTLNDILEAIVGEIHTDHEPNEPQAIQREDGSWLVDGLLPVEELQELFGIHKLPAGEEDAYQTLGGFVVAQLGRIPVPGEYFEWNKLRFEVIDLDSNRVDKVLVVLIH